MKKLIAVLALSALAACGGSDEPGSTQNSVTPENNAPEATAPTMEPATPTPAPVDSATTAAPAH